MVSIVILSAAEGHSCRARIADNLERLHAEKGDDIFPVEVAFDTPSLGDKAWDDQVGGLIDDADIVAVILTAGRAPAAHLRRAIARAKTGKRLILPIMADTDLGLAERFDLVEHMPRALPSGGIANASGGEAWFAAVTRSLEAQVALALSGRQSGARDLVEAQRACEEAASAVKDAAAAERHALDEDFGDAVLAADTLIQALRSPAPQPVDVADSLTQEVATRIEDREGCGRTEQALSRQMRRINALNQAREQAGWVPPAATLPKRTIDRIDPQIAGAMEAARTIADEVDGVVRRAREIAADLPSAVAQRLGTGLERVESSVFALRTALGAEGPARVARGRGPGRAARHRGRRGGTTVRTLETTRQSAENAVADLRGLRGLPAPVRKALAAVVARVREVLDFVRNIIDAAMGLPAMVPIPAGSFRMGSPETEDGRFDNESPQTQITFGHRFALGRTPVTFAQWDAALAAGAQLHKPDDFRFGRGDHPVIDVSWEDAHAYMTWLNQITGLTGRPDCYRLPSEAEWEYACRAGTQTRYSFGDELSPNLTNYDEHPVEGTTSVTRFPPNDWGLYDMHGNVFEWCEDAWSDSHKGASKTGEARRGHAKSPRVLRGGSWYGTARAARSAYRGGDNPVSRGYDVGFRLARTLSDPAS